MLLNFAGPDCELNDEEPDIFGFAVLHVFVKSLNFATLLLFAEDFFFISDKIAVGSNLISCKWLVNAELQDDEEEVIDEIEEDVAFDIVFFNGDVFFFNVDDNAKRLASSSSSLLAQAFSIANKLFHG